MEIAACARLGHGNRHNGVAGAGAREVAALLFLRAVVVNVRHGNVWWDGKCGSGRRMMEWAQTKVAYTRVDAVARAKTVGVGLLLPHDSRVEDIAAGAYWRSKCGESGKAIDRIWTHHPIHLLTAVLFGHPDAEQAGLASVFPHLARDTALLLPPVEIRT